MTLRRAVIALLLSGAAIATSWGSAMPAAAATADAKASIAVAPAAGGVVKQGSSVTLEVTVTNSGSAPLRAGTITFGLDGSAAATASTLTDRIKDPVLADYNVGSTASPVVPAGATSAPIHTKIPAALISAKVGDIPGAHLISAQLTVAGETAAIGATVITSISPSFTATASLATVVPFTAPTTADGLVSATTLAALTSEPVSDGTTDGDTAVSPNETGAWTAELRALRGTDATIALDPAIIASIRVLGSAAPTTAVTFLDDLEALPNEFVLLPYADADLPLERAAGATTALAPLSFASVLNQDNFLTDSAATPTPTLTPSAAATDTATPTPTPTATTPVLPTTAQILEWSDATTTIAWPGTRQTTAADLKFLKSSGYSQVLLSSGDVHDTAARAAAGPRARIGSTAALISDATLSGLLNTAVATNTTTSRAALAELLALLATNASAHTVTSVLATVQRSTADPDALGAVLDVLANQSWIDPGSIRELRSAGTATKVTLRGGGSTPAARIATAKPLIRQEAAGRQLLAAATGSDPLVSQQNLTLLGTLSTEWTSDDSGWGAAASTASTLFSTTLKSVYIDPSSPVTYYGGSGSLPVKLQNKLPYPITVVVHGKASNGRLVVGADQKVVIQASAPSQPKLPIRSISNGEVQVSVTLTTPAGVPVGTRLDVSIDVNAGWETVAAVVFTTALAALFGTGIYRNITRRRRREKRREAA